MYKSPVFYPLHLTIALFCIIIGFALQSCDHPTPCEGLICPPNSECVITTDGVASCECKLGYVKEGDTCRYEPCSIHDCYNDGICYVDSLQVPHCQCPIEYVGEHCERYNECYGNLCGGHGHCELDSLYNARCICDPGFVGSDCHPDLCIGVVCPYINNLCDEGICECKKGYEGDTCGILIRNKFLGNYMAIDTCYSSDSLCRSVKYLNFPVTITADPDSITRFIINNFEDKGNSIQIKAEVRTFPFLISTQFVILPNQTVAGQSVSGVIDGPGFINTTTNVIRVRYNHKNTDERILILTPQ